MSGFMRSDGGNFDLSHTLRQVYLPTRQVLSPTISALFSMHTHTHTQAHGLANGGIGILGIGGCGGPHWSSFPNSMNRGLEKDGKNKNIACFSQLTRHNHTHTAKTLSKCKAAAIALRYMAFGWACISFTVRSAETPNDTWLQINTVYCDLLTSCPAAFNDLINKIFDLALLLLLLKGFGPLNQIPLLQELKAAIDVPVGAGK